MKNKYISISMLLSLIVVLSAIFPGNLANAKTSVKEEGASCGIDRGLDIVFAIDTSGNMNKNDPSNIRIEAAQNMVEDLRKLDRFGVIGFSEQAKNYQTLTEDPFKVNQALNNLKSTGGSSIPAGLEMAINELRTNSYTNHKIIILLTDGNSPETELSLKLADEAAAEGITIHTIALGTSSQVNKDLLEKIAIKTNGNYSNTQNASELTEVFKKISHDANNSREPKVPSNWTLTNDVRKTGDLVIEENTVVDLNGYNLTVDGALILLPCAELRAISGTVNATMLQQDRGAVILLNNSRLKVSEMTQNGVIQVNGDFKGGQPELEFGSYTQGRGGVLELNGHEAVIEGSAMQEGTILLGEGNLSIKKDLIQKGSVDLQRGTLRVGENLTIAGGLLIDKEFKENDSLDINGGLLEVGSEEMMNTNREKGNVIQESGQLNVNRGTAQFYGDYTIKDGWLTMTKGSMDTTVPDYGEGDGDYVYVHRDFTMASPRNHGGRAYTELMKNKDDWPHLTDGVLQVDGKFIQKGNASFHPVYSDRSRDYANPFSRYNFQASGRHKVLLTGNISKSIQTEGTGFTFQNLQVNGVILDYLGTSTGQTKWNHLMENNPSANTNLGFLSISGKAVEGFKPEKRVYDHNILRNTVTGPANEIKVDARAEDHRNAKVTVSGNVLQSDGTATIQIRVVGADGESSSLYTVNVTVDNPSKDFVTSLELDREKVIFVQDGSNYNPNREIIEATIKPNTALNQQIIWTSTNSTVATVANGVITPRGPGTASIIAKTVDGGFVKTVSVEVRGKHVTLQGVKTLADLVSDTERYNLIMSLYNHDDIGIVVPGKYLTGMTFTQAGQHVTGTIQVHSDVKDVRVIVNGQKLPAVRVNTTEFMFQRYGLQIGDYVEIQAYNNGGDLVEKIGQSYNGAYVAPSTVTPGFHSIKSLVTNPILFNLILDNYAPEDLLFQ